MKLLENLNPVQKDAVTSTEGPLLILAGAGSGKTRVLTHRIAYLIQSQGVNPYNILAITFTNKAAGEMKERIESLVGRISENMWICTFHSACGRILRREIEKLGYKSNFTIYDQDDQTRLIRNCLRDLNYDTKKYSPVAIRSIISNAKNELIDADTYALKAVSYIEQIASEVYKLYQEKLYQNNAVDFDDMIMLTVNIFNIFPDVLEKYQNRFKYILVDEYQDTNYAQYVLVNLLSAKYRNLCVVGDDDQSIYRFRGADIRNILEFESDYPEAVIIKLEQNYRSTNTILEAANYVVKNNVGRKPKTLWTANAKGESVTVYQAENEHDEALFVQSEIKRLKDTEGRKYNDFAVFYRTNAQSRVFEEIFIRRDLPYKIVGGVRFYERQEIKDILAYLRVVSNPLDSVSLKRIINKPRREIGDTTIAQIDKFALLNRIAFFEALKRSDEIFQLSDRAKKNIKNFVNMIDNYIAVKNSCSIEELTNKILEETKYLAQYEKEQTIEALGRIENLKEFIAVVKEFQLVFPEKTLDEFLEGISLIADIDNYSEASDAVTLMTFHNAKGLEFPVVFMVGMEDGVFPHIRSLGNPIELEEERRLCYVGITRARERLYLTHSWSRDLYGNTNYNPVSRFLKEIPEELVNPVDLAGIADDKDDSKEENASFEFSLGDEVVHKKWGKGKIVEVKSENEVTVLFVSEGKKKLLLNYAPLQKVEG
ncbi:MAG: DNA helicase PcrA [Actinobacteria bacterium]|nr:DNA helicase PcrA [Actinomycetota bacterium]